MANKAKRRIRSWERIAWTLAWRVMRRDIKDPEWRAYWLDENGLPRPDRKASPIREMRRFYIAAWMGLAACGMITSLVQ